LFFAHRETMVGSRGPWVLLSRQDVVALDCEMVGVAVADAGPAGSRSIKDALCRVSVVSYATDWECQVLLDTWVEVEGLIVDYRSSITGIDRWSFAHKTKVTFEEAQSQVQVLICDKIVVGHAIWNDFAALRLMHPADLTRDTAVCPLLRPPWRLNKLPSLRLLAKLWLQLEIQGGRHDSNEDAFMPLMLYSLIQANWERLCGNVCMVDDSGCVSIWLGFHRWAGQQLQQARLSQAQQACLSQATLPLLGRLSKPLIAPAPQKLQKADPRLESLFTSKYSR